MSLADAWDFFSDPRQLDTITPPELEFRITSGEPPEMFEGQIITYRIRVAPLVWQRWVTEIKAVVPGVQFVDEQRSGPYRFWHHLHRFERDASGVKIMDEVNYALPFGPLGSLAHSLFVKGKLRHIFGYRRDVLAQQFGEVTRRDSSRDNLPSGGENEPVPA